MELSDLETELVKLKEEKASIKKPIAMNLAWIIIVVRAIFFCFLPMTLLSITFIVVYRYWVACLYYL